MQEVSSLLPAFGLGDQIQIVRNGGKYIYWQSHLPALRFLINPTK